MKFYLGTHEPHWLRTSTVPLFISAVRLRLRFKKKLPRARVPWALDSGGFSVIKGPEGYPQKAAEYAAEVRRWANEIGHLDWAAIQDWMCEPIKLNLTGFTVRQHQERTVQSWIDLRALAPDLPWVPVLQGFTRDEYHRCAELYADSGTDLTALPTVGIGSVCRRQDTREAERIIRELAAKGIRLHGFGFKMVGLENCADALASADSLAWSDGARRANNANRKRHRLRSRMADLFDCGDEEPDLKTKANCPITALQWQAEVLVRAKIKPERQLAVCPWCESCDVMPPVGELEWVCVRCGEKWGDIREPQLGDEQHDRRRNHRRRARAVPLAR